MPRAQAEVCLRTGVSSVAVLTRGHPAPPLPPSPRVVLHRSSAAGSTAVLLSGGAAGLEDSISSTGGGEELRCRRTLDASFQMTGAQRVRRGALRDSPVEHDNTYRVGPLARNSTHKKLASVRRAAPERFFKKESVPWGDCGSRRL